VRPVARKALDARILVDDVDIASDHIGGERARPVELALSAPNTFKRTSDLKWASHDGRIAIESRWIGLASEIGRWKRSGAVAL
jgi:hypothetical protein